MSVQALLRARLRSIEDWWFDTTRGVDTAGNAKVPSSVAGDRRDSYGYLPARAANIRAALRRVLQIFLEALEPHLLQEGALQGLASVGKAADGGAGGVTLT